MVENKVSDVPGSSLDLSSGSLQQELKVHSDLTNFFFIIALVSHVLLNQRVNALEANILSAMEDLMNIELMELIALFLRVRIL